MQLLCFGKLNATPFLWQTKCNWSDSRGGVYFFNSHLDFFGKILTCSLDIFEFFWYNIVEIYELATGDGKMKFLDGTVILRFFCGDNA